MNEDGLLPCPFCGSAEVSHSVGSKGDGSEWPYVECESCAAATEPDVWNRRSDASLADEQAEIARLRGALEGMVQAYTDPEESDFDRRLALKDAREALK